ncbi:CpaF family protein [Terrabacter sp. Root181]|uniref:CpaF family protein n=1 Tax=Terrabacter sp. Root181 TaxID=1736484 RepID=UPI000AA1BC50|nr:ATPase, T2SS/T4P/T4SS family [Terrabacter sp. Root181]
MSTQEAVRHVEGEVRELIRRSGLDPASDSKAVRRLVQEAVQDYDERSLHGGLPSLGDQRLAVHSILAVVAGYGPLQQYFDDAAVEEIWINEPSRVFVARGGIAELTPTILTADEVRDLVERMLKSSGRRVDLSSPFVDATLADGSRLHVVIPDISRTHWQVNIRKFVVKADHLDDLVRLGTMPRQAATFLEAAVASGLNVLVAGGTQAGKTTLLNCLAAAIPPRERIVTCEEVFELKIPQRDVAAMQCRQPSLEGTGEVPLRRLVKEALRMRPSRIIVGEVRQEESLDLLIALNSGVPAYASGAFARAARATASTRRGRSRLRQGVDVARCSRNDTTDNHAAETRTPSVTAAQSHTGPPASHPARAPRRMPKPTRGKARASVSVALRSTSTTAARRERDSAARARSNALTSAATSAMSASKRPSAREMRVCRS